MLRLERFNVFSPAPSLVMVKTALLLRLRLTVPKEKLPVRAMVNVESLSVFTD
jgi:hypothetical protein